MEKLFFEKLVRDRKLLTEDQLKEWKDGEKSTDSTKGSLWELAAEKKWLDSETIESLRSEISSFLNKPDASISALPTNKESTSESSFILPKIFMSEISCPSCKKNMELSIIILSQGKPVLCPHCSHIIKKRGSHL